MNLQNILRNFWRSICISAENDSFLNSTLWDRSLTLYLKKIFQLWFWCFQKNSYYYQFIFGLYRIATTNSVFYRVFFCIIDEFLRSFIQLMNINEYRCNDSCETQILPINIANKQIISEHDFQLIKKCIFWKIWRTKVLYTKNFTIILKAHNFDGIRKNFTSIFSSEFLSSAFNWIKSIVDATNFMAVFKRNNNFFTGIQHIKDF